MTLIDREPPARTGDDKKDLTALIEYSSYLVEQLNFILININKERKDNGK